MEEYILWGIFIISIILFMLILEYIHIPRYRISDDIKKQILNKGLIHFTLLEQASEIQKDGLVPGKRKAMNIFEKNMVWLYINNEEEFQQKCDIVHSKGDRRVYNAVVIFKDIEEKHIRHMRYRKTDMAVVHKGILNTSNVMIEKLVQGDKKNEIY
ncbi:MAG: hypothetical protein VB018_11460 [Lachnospiraceae bacterium]|nr:hypothetical protein [Lachnospiraceae bacterium]